MMAQYWIEAMEKNFRTIQCAEEEKVVFATHMLQDEVETWWRGTHAYMVAQGDVVNLGELQEDFSQEALPNSDEEKEVKGICGTSAREQERQ